MDREMKQMMGVLAACWIAAAGLIVTGLLLAVFGGAGAVRVFVLVLLGVSLANVMLMLLVRVYTRLRCDLPIVGGIGMAMGCGLLLLPAASGATPEWEMSDGLGSLEIVRTEDRDRVIRPVRFEMMPWMQTVENKFEKEGL